MRAVNEKFIILVFFVIVLVIVWILIPCVGKAKLNAKIQAEIQNLHDSPAAQYCKNDWWELDIKVNELSDVYGMCNFKDGSSCEIMKYFRWECLSASEQDENESLYCSNWSTCDDEEATDLSSRIEDMNNIEYLDKENLNEELSDDDLNKMDIDTLYEYYENQFNNSGDLTSNKSKLKWWAIWSEPSCDSVWWTIIGDKCYLSNWIEIAF